MKSILLNTLFLLISVGLFGQDIYLGLKFQETKHDFGEIYENHGSVWYTFSFVNKGTNPVIVRNVSSTCGCTVPSWTEGEVAVDSVGLIKVEFNPQSRYGDFSETIQLLTNLSDSGINLTISGKVLASFIEEPLNYTIGKLSIESKHVNLGYIYKGEKSSKTVAIANHTKEALELELGGVPGYIDAFVIPSVLKPGEYGRIQIDYYTQKVDDWDVVIDRIPIVINGQADRKAKLVVTANIREDFSNLSDEELLTVPVAYFSETLIRHDTIAGDKPVDCKFQLKNNGQSDLIIRTVKPSCGCTVVKTGKPVLHPDESTFIQVRFDPQGLSGNFRKATTVVTNDPYNYKQYIWVEGYIAR